MFCLCTRSLMIHVAKYNSFSRALYNFCNLQCRSNAGSHTWCLSFPAGVTRRMIRGIRGILTVCSSQEETREYFCGFPHYYFFTLLALTCGRSPVSKTALLWSMYTDSWGGSQAWRLERNREKEWVPSLGVGRAYFLGTLPITGMWNNWHGVRRMLQFQRLNTPPC